MPLIAHTYVRYMGDLSGGQVLKRMLGRTLGIGPDGLSFYDFPGIDDVVAFKADYLAAISEAASTSADIKRVTDEAVAVFELNIDVSIAVLEAAEGH